jgi:hypothetical protein
MRTRDRSRQASLFRYSPLVAALACVLPTDASAITYIVTSTADTGGLGCSTNCTLRQAVEQSVANCTSDPAPVIAFAIPGPGPFVISTATPLNFDCSQPANFTIDATTQPGYAPNTDPNGFNAALRVALDGTAATFGDGININAFPYGNSLTILGLEVRNFQYGAGISGNVQLRGSHVHSNTFGLDPHGFDGLNRAVVGGAGLTDRNLIRNNIISGIDVSYGGFVDIINNLIGLAASGTAASPNDQGVVIENANDVTIQGNYVSGNSTRGVVLTNNFSGTVTVVQNKIGLTPAATPLGNGSQGVRVEGSQNLPILNNVIAHNAANGVQFVDDFSSGVLISQNSIHSNVAKNIDLNSPGTPRPQGGADPLDGDNGPNAGQNFPVITSVLHVGGNTHVAWTLDSNPSATFRLEFFSNLAPGTPAGATFLQTSANQTTSTGGTVSGVEVIAGLHDNVSATATNIANNNTSEFSAAVALTPTPAVTVAPNPLNFPNTVVGASSGPSTITITSTGTAPYVVSAFSADNTCYGGPICASGAFSCSNSCTTGTPYAPSASCNIDVTFSPIAAGTQTTTFYICDNASGSPRSVVLSGNAVAPPPATLSPPSFDFGTAQVGGFSGFQTFTLTNSGPTAMSIGPFTTTGPFQVVAGSCGANLGPSSSCTLDGRFAPTVPGPASGTIDVGTGLGPVSATVSGNGVAPPPTTITPVSFDFGSHEVGTTSLTAFFTISNPSLVPVTLTPVVTSGPFTLVSSSCGSTLPPSTSCNASAQFQPVAVGPASGTIGTVANGNNLSAALSGTGTPIPPPPAVTVTPLSTDFGTVTVGTSSSPVAFSIFNPSPSVAATLGTLSTTGPYVINSTTCAGTLPANSGCTADVSFFPSAPGAAPGTFVVPASTGTVTANLNGTGLAAAALAISPPAFDFGPVLVGMNSNSKTFVITNPNSVPVPLTSITTTGPFAIVNTSCLASLNPSASCDTNVRFRPTAHGTASGTLVVDTGGMAAASPKSAAFGTSTAALAGTGLLQSALELPSSIDMGAGTFGGAPIRRTIVLTNGGNAALSIESITISQPFTLTHDCPINLLPGRSCNVNLELEPTSLGTFNATLVVFSNSAGGVRSVPVRASVQPRPEPVVRVSPSTIGFGARMAGTQAPSQRVTVTNEGGADAVGLSLGFNTPHFLVQNSTCGQTLAPQSTCFADVVFAPVGFGPRRDAFSVRSSNDPNSPAVVNVSGAGCRPVPVTASRGGTQVNCSP